MTDRVVIVGAGRQGRNVLEILAQAPSRFAVAGFLDDTRPVGTAVLGTPVIGGFALMAERTFVEANAWFVALGEGTTRLRIGTALRQAGATFVNAIHASADVSRFAGIGVGVYLAAFTRVGSGSRLGDFALVETNSMIGCDTHVGSGVSFGPGCVLAGGASVGDRSFIGAGTVVSNERAVGAGCVIGANSVVVRDIPDGIRAQGAPARPA